MMSSLCLDTPRRSVRLRAKGNKMKRNLTEFEKERNRVVEENIGLAISVASIEFSNATLPLQDRINEGVEGLMRAYDKYNPEKGPFATYAVWWIRQRIRRAVKHDAVVWVPEQTLLDRAVVHKYRETEYRKTGERPTIEDAVEINHRRIQQCRKTAIETCEMYLINPSMDEESIYNYDDRPKTLHDILYNDDPSEFEDFMEWPVVRRAIDSLSDRTRQILRWRYGFGGVQALTLQEIAAIFGLTRERIRQILKDAIEQLRDMLEIEEAS